MYQNEELDRIDWMFWSSNRPRVSESCWIGTFYLVCGNGPTQMPVKLEPICCIWQRGRKSDVCIQCGIPLQPITRRSSASKPSHSKASPAFSLSTAIHAAETGFFDTGKPPRHRFEVCLVWVVVWLSDLDQLRRHWNHPRTLWKSTTYMKVIRNSYITMRTPHHLALPDFWSIHLLGSAHMSYFIYMFL